MGRGTVAEIPYAACGPVSAFDRQPPHRLVPATRVLIATDVVRRSGATEADTVHLTAVAEVGESVLADPQTAGDVLVIDRVATHHLPLTAASVTLPYRGPTSGTRRLGQVEGGMLDRCRCAAALDLVPGGR